VFSFSWHKKFIFHFLSAKNGFFVKHLQKICFKNGTPQFYNILYHILCTIHQFFARKKLSRRPSRNWQNYADSVGSGSNLNYRCFIFCSSFFQKKYFYVHKHLFHQRSINSFARVYPVLGMVTPAVFTAFWNWHKKFKKIKTIQNLRVVSCYVT
jgi:hypothetical protein